MKPLVLFSSLAVLCAGGLLALSYQGWRDDPSVVTALNTAGQPVEIKADGAEQKAAGSGTGEQPSGTAAKSDSGGAAPGTQPQTGEPAPKQDQVAAVAPSDTTGASRQQEQPADQLQGDDAVQSPVSPSFDMMRVEQDGSAVLAGRAMPGAKVVALLDGQPIGEETANDRGEWVIVPSQALPAGAHEVTLEQTAADGSVTKSDQAVAFTVSETPNTQPLIVLSENAKPSRVLQKPDAGPEAKSAEQVAVVQPDTSATGEAGQQPKAEEPAAPEAKLPAETSEPEKQTTPATAAAGRQLTVDVVDYDDLGRTTFSGSAPPGAKVRIYVSDMFAGEATAAGDGRWSLTAAREIAAGTHTLRADQVAAAGAVMQRIELPFLRESQERIAALQEQRKAEQPAEPAPASDTQVQPAQQPATEPSAATADSAQQSAGQSEATNTDAAVSSSTQAVGPAAGQAEQVAAATAPASDEAAKPAEPAKPGRVVIQPGNNLWQISRVIYGKGVQYTVIYEANKDQIRNPNLIYPGQIFDTPGSQAPESIDPDCRKPLAECEQKAQEAAQ